MRRSEWAAEGDQVVRAVSGGMLFGIPLLYTMEVWWIGASTPPGRLLVVLLASFVPVFLLTWMDGFRDPEEPGPFAALLESIESFGVGILSVTVVLLLIREIDGETPLLDALGKISFESIPFCLGVAVAGSVLSRGRDGSDGDDEGGAGQERERMRLRHPTLADLGATLVGAVFFAFNIAPTDEIPMLAAAASPPSLLALVIASLLLTYAIVFEAGFAKQDVRHRQEGVIQHPLTETLVAYVLALVAAAVLLWLFGNLELGGPWEASLQRVLLLGFPAAIGGAAGRLVV